MAHSMYECNDVQQWDGATGKKPGICEMYLHPSGMLGATPDRLLEVKTLPKVAKKGITLEEYIRDNERLQDCHLYRKRYS